MNALIKEKLSFLISEFNFDFQYTWQTPDAEYIFENQFGKFIFNELPQFQERFFYVIDSQGKREINIYKNFEMEYKEWQNGRFSIIGRFKKKENALWDLNVRIIKDSIKKTNTLFGLRLK